MRARRPVLHAVRTGDYRAAIEAALRLALPGDVVLVLYEKLDPMMAALSDLGAVPASAGPVGLVRGPVADLSAR
jgi:cyanophycin synthetase